MSSARGAHVPWGTDPAFPAVSDASFDAVIADPALLVLDFYSASCAPCVQLARILKSIESDLPQRVRIRSVSVDENNRLVDHFHIRSVPTLIVLKDGQVVERLTGVERRQVVERAIVRHMDQSTDADIGA
jgi:thioredoxin 1